MQTDDASVQTVRRSIDSSDEKATKLLHFACSMCSDYCPGTPKLDNFYSFRVSRLIPMGRLLTVEGMSYSYVAVIVLRTDRA
jgi:hypothetical protein